MCPSPADFSFEGYLSSELPFSFPQGSLVLTLTTHACCCSRGSFFFFFLRFFSSFILWKLILKWMVHSQWDNIKDLTVISHSHKSELLLIQEHKVSVARAKQGETLDISWGSLGGLFLYKTYFLAHSNRKGLQQVRYACHHTSVSIWVTKHFYFISSLLRGYHDTFQECAS